MCELERERDKKKNTAPLKTTEYINSFIVFSVQIEATNGWIYQKYTEQIEENEDGGLQVKHLKKN